MTNTDWQFIRTSVPQRHEKNREHCHNGTVTSVNSIPANFNTELHYNIDDVIMQYQPLVVRGM